MMSHSWRVFEPSTAKLTCEGRFVLPPVSICPVRTSHSSPLSGLRGNACMVISSPRLMMVESSTAFEALLAETASRVGPSSCVVLPHNGQRWHDGRPVGSSLAFFFFFLLKAAGAGRESLNGCQLGSPIALFSSICLFTGK